MARVATPDKVLELRGSRHAGRGVGPAGGAPARPEYLSDAAADEWARVVPELAAMGLLGLADRQALVALCEAWSDYREMREVVSAEGYQTVNGAGNPVRHPAVIQMEQAFTRWEKLAKQFGMTPSARRAVDANQKKQSGGGKDKFFG